MAACRKQYLNHLKRWLNYEKESSTPPIVEECKAPPPKKPLPPKPRKRVDSQGSVDEQGFVNVARYEVAREVTKKNQLIGAARSKCVADQGKVACIPVVVLLPFCAREEANEEWATKEATLAFIKNRWQASHWRSVTRGDNILLHCLRSRLGASKMSSQYW